MRLFLLYSPLLIKYIRIGGVNFGKMGYSIYKERDKYAVND